MALKPLGTHVRSMILRVTDTTQLRLDAITNKVSRFSTVEVEAHQFEISRIYHLFCWSLHSWGRLNRRILNHLSSLNHRLILRRPLLERPLPLRIVVVVVESIPPIVLTITMLVLASSLILIMLLHRLLYRRNRHRWTLLRRSLTYRPHHHRLLDRQRRRHLRRRSDQRRRWALHNSPTPPALRSGCHQTRLKHLCKRTRFSSRRRRNPSNRTPESSFIFCSRGKAIGDGEAILLHQALAHPAD